MGQDAAGKMPARLANGDEADPESGRRGAAQHEAPRLNGGDMRDAVVLVRPHKREDAPTEEHAVGKQPPYVCVAVDPRNAGA